MAKFIFYKLLVDSAMHGYKIKCLFSFNAQWIHWDPKKLLNLWYLGIILLDVLGKFVKDLSFKPIFNIPSLELRLHDRFYYNLWFPFVNTWDNDFFLAWHFCLNTLAKLSTFFPSKYFFPKDRLISIPWFIKNGE